MLSPIFCGSLSILLAASGCATIASGTRQLVRFDSVPPGATVTITGHRSTTALEHFLCFPLSLVPLLWPPEHVVVTSPAEVALPRRNSYDIRYESPGYEVGTSRLIRAGNPEVEGDVFAAFLGLCVDFVTGAAWTLAPEVQSVSLKVAPTQAR